MAADPLTQALIAHLVRTGAMDADDIDEIATRLEAQDEPEAAHLARCCLLRAIEPSQSEWNAARRRRRFEVVPTDGGKGPA